METPQALFQSTKFIGFKAKTVPIYSVSYKTTGYKEDIFHLFNSRGSAFMGRKIILMLLVFMDVNSRKLSFSSSYSMFNLYQTVASRNISKILIEDVLGASPYVRDQEDGKVFI